MKRLLLTNAHPLACRYGRTASTFEDGLALAEMLLPDVIFVDLALPLSQHNRQRIRIEDVRHLLTQIGVPVIALFSPSVAPEIALLLLYEGTVQALLDKDALGDHLSNAERHILRGECYAYFQGKAHDVDVLLSGIDVFELRPEQAYILSLLSEKANLRYIAERLGCSRPNAYLLLQELTNLFRVTHFTHVAEAASRLGILSCNKVVSQIGVRQLNKSNSLAMPKMPASGLFLGHSLTERIAI